MRRFLFYALVGIVAVLVLRAHGRQCGRERPVVVEPHRVVFAQVDGDQVVLHDYLVQDRRESVSDIPVPIVPGTRVSRAEIEPPQPASRPHPPTVVRPAKPHRAPRPVQKAVQKAKVPDSAFKTITGRLSATEQRARDDARLQVERAVASWLEPEVPRSWKTPRSIVDSMIRQTEVKSVEKDLGTLYEATVKVEMPVARRTAIVERYHHELIARRLTILGGVLAFVLICLAALSGYIRTDEATKGYYTNRLRVVTAAGVGGAGVLIYHLLT